MEALTDILRDPACLGSLKDAVLLRIEELAYPNPAQAAGFVGLAANPLSRLMIPAIKIAADKERKFNRRFRTVSDAAQWIAEHHPEIDLERPYHKK